MSPCQAVDENLFVFAGKFGSPTKTQMFQKIQNKNNFGEEKQTVTGWQRFIEHVCQISESVLKNGLDTGCVTNFGRYA